MCVILNLKRKSLRKTLLMCSVSACSFASALTWSHRSVIMCHGVWHAGSDLIWLSGGWQMQLQDRLSEQVAQGRQGKGVESFFLVSSQPLFDMPWNVNIIPFSDKTLNVFIICRWLPNHNSKRSVADPWNHTTFIVFSITLLLNSKRCFVRSIEK